LVRVGAGAIWKKDLNRKSRVLRHVQGDLPDSYTEHENTFDEEEPSPSLSACYTSHPENSEGDQWSNDVDQTPSNPEQAQPQWQLFSLEKVRLAVSKCILK
jgi:hypothetical protein